jgi:O-antigen ligase
LHLSTDARLAAQGSTQWRLDMWQALLPEIPKHLLLGKGYAITTEDLAAMGNDSAIRSVDPAQQGLAISGDYHSGPLSVIIPFGIWGTIAFLWLIIVSLRVMYRNFRYGDPSLKLVNTFLFTSYVMGVFNFFFIAGAFNTSMLGFCGTLGLSISINNGVCQPSKVPAKNILFGRRFAEPRSRPQPAFQRRFPGADPV